MKRQDLLAVIAAGTIAIFPGCDLLENPTSPGRVSFDFQQGKDAVTTIQQNNQYKTNQEDENENERKARTGAMYDKTVTVGAKDNSEKNTAAAKAFIEYNRQAFRDQQGKAAIKFVLERPGDGKTLEIIVSQSKDGHIHVRRGEVELPENPDLCKVAAAAYGASTGGNEAYRELARLCDPPGGEKPQSPASKAVNYILGLFK
ncbi:hypothetical protein JW826_02970 [Candidatus Woesearchaeota archaeon]|nr:hypothetical protein [Candidatus Woesearchaeota archaeon]